MNEPGTNVGPTSVADYAAIFWRRRFWLLLALIGVPVVAVLLSTLQSPEYRASAQALIRTENLAAALAGVSDTPSSGDPQRLLDTQAKLARTAAVAGSAVALAKSEMSASEFLKHSSVSADQGTDILTFSVRDSSPDEAILLANAYADAFTRYRAAFDLAPVKDALATVNARIEKLRASRSTDSPLYATLLVRQQELASLKALGAQSAVVVEKAVEAPKTKPRLYYAGVIGLVVGGLLGVGIALAREAIEKRPRSAEEVQDRLGLRVLGRIPETPEGASGLVVLSDPDSIDAESYRRLRMYFEQVADEMRARVFAFVSASEGEGKSTIASNLAFSLANAGRDVILVDGDPLRPVLRKRLGIGRLAPGVFEVATGRERLENSLAKVVVDWAPPAGALPESTHGPPSVHFDNRPARLTHDEVAYIRDPEPFVRGAARNANHGSLRILPADPTSVELSDYLVATKFEALFDQLRQEADFVLVDAASLTTSPGMGVARLADGLVVVTNMSLMRRPILEQLTGMLDELATPKVGLVLTGMGLDATLPYGYRSYYTPAPSVVESSLSAPQAESEATAGRHSSAS